MDPDSPLLWDFIYLIAFSIISIYLTLAEAGLRALAHSGSGFFGLLEKFITEDQRKNARLKTDPSLILSLTIARYFFGALAAALAILLIQKLTSSWQTFFSLLASVLTIYVCFLILPGIFCRLIKRVNLSSFILFSKFFRLLLYPLFMLTSFLIGFNKLSKEDKSEDSEDHLIHRMVDERIQGLVEEDEREMIHSVMDFEDTRVYEVMIPRIDIDCIDKDSSLEDLRALVLKHGHSRIPVFSGRIDNIIGIVYAKDLLRFGPVDESAPKTVEPLMRKPYFIPESKKIIDLLKEFQKDKIHVAVVVDEYGGTAGLVTLEDLLEEIVGEIEDEYDAEEVLIKIIDEFIFLVDAKIDIEELEEFIAEKIAALREKKALEAPQKAEEEEDFPFLKISFPEGDYETLSGFLFTQFGKVPTEGESIVHSGWQFKIIKADQKRIIKVRIQWQNQSEKLKIEKDKELNK